MVTSCNNFRALFRPGHKYGGKGYVLKKVKMYPDGLSGVYVINKPLEAEDALTYHQSALDNGEFLVYVGPLGYPTGEDFHGVLSSKGRYRMVPTWDTTFPSWAFKEGILLTRDCSYTPCDPRTIQGFRQGEAEEIFFPASIGISTSNGWTQYHTELTTGDWETYRERFTTVPYTTNHTADDKIILTVLVKNRRYPGIKETLARNARIISTLTGQLNYALWIAHDEKAADEIYQQWRGEQKRLYGRKYPVEGLSIISVLMQEDKLSIEEALGRLPDGDGDEC